MAEPLDYLGRPAPVSLAERPALPEGGAPLGVSTAPSTASGGGTVPGSALGAPLTTGSGMVATTPSGVPGVPGAPGAAQSVEIARMGGGGENANLVEMLLKAGESGVKVYDALKRLGLFGSEGADSVLNAADFSLSSEGGGDVLSPEGFSLSGSEGKAPLTADSFKLGIPALDAQLPGEMFKLALKLGDVSIPDEMFSFGGGEGGGLDTRGFSFGGETPDSVLSPGEFSTGADTSMQAPTGEAGGADWGAIASQVLSFVNMFGQFLPPEAQFALQQVGQMAASAGNPFMAAWNAPQNASVIHDFIEGPETEERRFKRTRDATDLSGEMLNPLMQAKTPDEFRAALRTPVGGSTIGDSLAAILRNNLSGTWASDTTHGWRPDTSLVQLQMALAQEGYAGLTEPTRGDVGGVGEIVAGAGRHLIPPEYLAAYEEMFRKRTGSGEGGDSGTYAGYGGGTSAPAGALGWESLLRQLTQTPGSSMVVPPQLPGSPSHPVPQNTMIAPEYVMSEQGLTMVPRPLVDWNIQEQGEGRSMQATRNGAPVDAWGSLLPAPTPEYLSQLDAPTAAAVQGNYEKELANLINNVLQMSSPGGGDTSGATGSSSGDTGSGAE